MRVHHKQRMLTNEWNEARYVHLEEILEVMQAEISSFGKEDSREKTDVSPMDEVSTV